MFQLIQKQDKQDVRFRVKGKKKLSKATDVCTETQAVQFAKSTAICSLNFGILGLLLV